MLLRTPADASIDGNVLPLNAAGLLAVGLQAQLRDAEAHAGEAQADRAGVRTAALQLVRDTAALFQLTATEVFGDAAGGFAQQEVSALHTLHSPLQSARVDNELCCIHGSVAWDIFMLHSIAALAPLYPESVKHHMLAVGS